MKIYDISMPIHGAMPVYKNKAEKKPEISTHKQGYVTETVLRLDAHCGTHLDAPLHMLPGAETVEAYNLGRLIGPCRVLDFCNISGGISEDDLRAKEIPVGEFLLLKTRNSWSDIFEFDFIYLQESGAKYLRDLPVKGIGIDALGIERDQPGHPTHKHLLHKGIPVVEGLRLKEVEEGKYFLVVAPLRFINTEAAPARVILLSGAGLQ